MFTTDVEDELETWDDQASLDAHMQQPHTQKLLATIADWVTAVPVITTYDVPATR